MKSLHAQTQAVETAMSTVGRAPPKMRPGEIELQTENLKAAWRTLLTLQSWRTRLPVELFAEIEGE